MEVIAFILAIVAIVLFFVDAFRVRPVNIVTLGWALLGIALLIWHVVGGLEPVFKG